ncbi:MAG TPA: cupin domain-containing protein [Microbacterium sp.]|nr:cupin domain-containing protein [Microbacterium sp.]
MTGRMPAGTVTDAAFLPVAHEPVDPAKIVAGTPTTGTVEFDDATGVWEMTPGTMRDVEIDELFVVVAGDATVDFVHSELPSIRLGPGAVVRLEAGMNTVWTVRQTLRKVYLVL